MVDKAASSTLIPIAAKQLTAWIQGIEKAKLWSVGQKIPDFDLLIGATALYHGLVLGTNHTRHFERMQNVKLENWIRE